MQAPAWLFLCGPVDSTDAIHPATVRWVCVARCGMIITLPWPPKELSPNARVHWARGITSRDRAGLPVNKNDLATAKEF